MSVDRKHEFICLERPCLCRIQYMPTKIQELEDLPQYLLPVIQQKHTRRLWPEPVLIDLPVLDVRYHSLVGCLDDEGHR